MARFAHLRSLQTFEQRQKQTSTCSTRPGIARARPGAQPRAHRAKPNPCPARTRAYKASQGFDRTPLLALNLAGAPVHRRLLCARRASGHPRTDRRRPAILAIPRPVRPSRVSTCLSEAPRAGNRALPRRRHWISVAGLHQIAGARRPSSTVNFSRFLAWVNFLAPREAPCALGLNPTAVSRPEHTSPTSPTACAHGPTDFGHHRR